MSHNEPTCRSWHSQESLAGKIFLTTVYLKDGTFLKFLQPSIKDSWRWLLASSAIVLGAILLESPITPLWPGERPLLAQASQSAPTREDFSVTFVDVAEEAGLTVPNVWGGVATKTYILEGKGSGLAFWDYDHDGWLDIYLTNGMRLGETYAPGKAPTNHLYKNNRDGTFTDVTERSGLTRSGWGVGVCVGDYDNDGWDDLFLTYWGQNGLYHNDGDGTFSNLTEKAGLLQSRRRWNSGCTFLDYDRDGHLDLFVANYLELELDHWPKPGEVKGYCEWNGVPVFCGPRGLPGGINTLYHNNGDGTFTDLSQPSGILKPGPRYSITPNSLDFNNDGWPDIYVAVDSAPSILYRNDQDGTFTNVALEAGCAYSVDGRAQAGMGVGVGDYNGDGRLDIYKTNFSDDTANLYANNGDGTFEDLTYAAGLGVNRQYVGWGAGIVDVDNDGWPDIFQVNGHVYPEIDAAQLGQRFKQPRLLYRNLGNGRFQDVSKLAGSGITNVWSSRGCAFGDFDNDGDLDVVVLNMNDRPSLIRNDNGNENNWLLIKLHGTSSNRTAIGASVRVGTGSHLQTNEVQSGGSVMSQSDLRLHFGLGQAKRADFIEVKWPASSQEERFTDIEANQIIHIKEGEGIVKAQKIGLRP